MNYKYNMLYFRKWGSKDPYQEFPYSIGNDNYTENSLPVHDESNNDVDLDSYTNTKGYTIRNRVRSGVYSLDFNVSTMSGKEWHKFNEETKDVWFECYFFSRYDWKFVSKKLYRSGTVKKTNYYLDEKNPDNDIYTDIQFSLIEQ